MTPIYLSHPSQDTDLVAPNAEPSVVVSYSHYLGRAFHVYDANYDVLSKLEMLRGGRKTYLGNEADKRCRFCQKAEPDVTFKLRAHAIPECTGNRNLFTHYECDSCNAQFGEDIETQFGKWSSCRRSFGKVRGKRGVPDLVRENSDWSIRHNHEYPEENIVQITTNALNPVLEWDESAKRLHVKIPVDPHIPIAVLKTFHKMALSIMPTEYVDDFRVVIDWIRNQNHAIAMDGLCADIGVGFSPRVRFEPGLAFLLRRHTDDLDLPYMVFVIAFGSFFYQTVLPCSASFQNREVSLPLFPFRDDCRVGLCNLSGTETVKTGFETMSFNCLSRTRVFRED